MKEEMKLNYYLDLKSELGFSDGQVLSQINLIIYDGFI